jgi:hypothetical protein
VLRVVAGCMPAVVVRFGAIAAAAAACAVVCWSGMLWWRGPRHQRSGRAHYLCVGQQHVGCAAGSA